MRTGSNKEEVESRQHAADADDGTDPTDDAPHTPGKDGSMCKDPELGATVCADEAECSEAQISSTTGRGLLIAVAACYGPSALHNLHRTCAPIPAALFHSSRFHSSRFHSSRFHSMRSLPLTVIAVAPACHRQVR